MVSVIPLLRLLLVAIRSHIVSCENAKIPIQPVSLIYSHHKDQTWAASMGHLCWISIVTTSCRAGRIPWLHDFCGWQNDPATPQRGIILYASNILKSDHTESYRKGASANPKPSWFMFNPLGLKSDGEFLCIGSSSQRYYSWLHGSSAALPSWLPHWMAPKNELWPSESCCSTLALALSRSCQKCARTTNKVSTRWTAKLCQVY